MTSRIAYIRPVNGLPLAIQREMVADANCHPVFVHGDAPGKDSRALWLARLQRGEVAVVPRLECIAMRANEIDERVSVDLSKTVMGLIARGIVIEDLQRGTTSNDTGFSDLLGRVMQGAHNIGRASEDVKKATAKARKSIRRGIVVKWRASGMKAERERQLTIWQSRKFSNDEEALAGLCPELANTSAATVRRIFFPHTRIPKRKKR